ncbi:Transcriptional regulator [Malassezia sp. CBS 17886]|nr:Transcriptional regulator [Malassezia sp. CBS 17886]
MRGPSNAGVVPAALRDPLPAALRRHVAASAGGMPPADELGQLLVQLQALRDDTDARLAQLVADRAQTRTAGTTRASSGAASPAGSGVRMKMREKTKLGAAHVKHEDGSDAADGAGTGDGDGGDSDVEWDSDTGAMRPAPVSRTYARTQRKGRRTGAKDGARHPGGDGDALRTTLGADASSSELDTDMDESDASLSARPLARAALRATPLGVKLKMNSSEDAARADAGGGTAVPRGVPETALFTDTTKFSWAAPPDVTTQILPRKERVRIPRPYPTHPLQVHDDFSCKDWRDRDAARSASPAPGVLRDGGGASGAGAAGRGRLAKETTQVPMTTFYNYADAYFKPVTEDDLAWLSSRADDPHPFEFPELGTHYRKVWEKEDAELLGVLRSLENAPAPPAAAKNARARARSAKDDDDIPLAAGAGAESAPAPAPTLARSLDQLTDADMYNRTASAGPLVERLAASLLLPGGGASCGGSDCASSADSARDAPSPSVALAVPPRTAPAVPPSAALSMQLSAPPAGPSRAHLPPPDPHKSMAEVETQARAECEAIGLLDTDIAIPWDEHMDSPIASALRLAQSLLKKQIHANEQRKARLFRIALDRMAYQDYQACLQAVDREIETCWTKRVRQIKASMGKKKKGAAAGSAGDSANGTSTPAGDVGPARPQLPDSLPAALQRRKKLKEAFEPMFANMEHACGPPSESIYQGIDDG